MRSGVWASVGQLPAISTIRNRSRTAAIGWPAPALEDQHGEQATSRTDAGERVRVRELDTPQADTHRYRDRRALPGHTHPREDRRDQPDPVGARLHGRAPAASSVLEHDLQHAISTTLIRSSSSVHDRLLRLGGSSGDATMIKANHPA